MRYLPGCSKKNLYLRHLKIVIVRLDPEASPGQAAIQDTY
jgi:hypothetical protein